MEAIRKFYPCRAVRRQVPIKVMVELVSGIGDDDEEVVELARACLLASRCPQVQQCPLTAGEGAGAA